jgi:hypothetical protein
MGNDSREKERGGNGSASPSKDTIDLGPALTSLNQYSLDKNRGSKSEAEAVKRHG